MSDAKTIWNVPGNYCHTQAEGLRNWTTCPEYIEAIDMAKFVVRNLWPAIEHIAQRLLQRRVLSGSEVERAVEDCRSGCLQNSSLTDLNRILFSGALKQCRSIF